MYDVQSIVLGVTSTSFGPGCRWRVCDPIAAAPPPVSLLLVEVASSAQGGLGTATTALPALAWLISRPIRHQTSLGHLCI